MVPGSSPPLVEEIPLGGERIASPDDKSSGWEAAPNALPYRIVAGDRVRIHVMGQEDLSLEIPVPPHGEIELPVVGTVPLLGRTTSEVSAHLLDRLEESGFLVSPRVNVVVTAFAPRQVFLIEGVRNPQAYDLPVGASLRLTQVLSMAGGLSESADPARVTILRRPASGPPRLIRVNLRAILDEERVDLDPVVEAGDSVIVRDLRQGESVVYVTGRVRKPGAYRFSPREGLTFFQAIILAGGLDQFAKPSECILLRTESGERQAIVVNLEQILAGALADDRYLQAGDVIFVPESFF
ncbi:MAG: SLBB domain-containing protein [Planctomycetota bacterium]